MWQSVKTGNVVDTSYGVLFTAAASAYSLMICQMPDRQKEAALLADLPKMCAYLDNSLVDIRIVAGESIALMYELGVQLSGDDWRPPNHQQTLERLDALANDALRFRAKKDRRVQRCTFRQIQSAVKDHDAPELKVKFGVDESLVLHTWTTKLCYDSFCSVLRSAMNVHLQKNSLLREIFDLGDVAAGHGAGGIGAAGKIERV